MNRILCVLSMIAISHSARAQQTYHVPSENISALSSALGAARCGDTVTIEGGHFNVCGLSLQVRQGVQVIGGFGGQGATVFFGQDACRILKWVPDGLCENGITTISNVVFSHGRLDETDSLGGGGAAVLVDGSDAAPLSKVRFVNCAFSNNQSFAGGGAVQALSVDLEVVNCSFTSNRTDNRIGGYTTSAESVGGAIVLSVSSAASPSARLLARGCGFQSNAALFGGAIHLSACPENATLYAEINECSFTANDAKAPNSDNGFSWSQGGAIATVCIVTLRINDCSFSGNRAGEGGGAILKHDLSAMQIKRSVFYGNQTLAGFGGAIAWGISGGGDAVANCDFRGNRTFAQRPDSAGGAIGFFNSVLTEGGYSVQVTNCVFAFNSAGSASENGLAASRGDGGAISVYGGLTVFLRQSTVVGNTVYSDQEGNGGSGRGPAVFSAPHLDSNPPLWPTVDISNTILFGASWSLQSHVCFADPNQSGQCTTAGIYASCNWIGGVVGDVVVGCNPSFADFGLGSLQLLADSDCIDSGCNDRVPADFLDVDDDLNQQESHPLDMAGRARTQARRLVRDPTAMAPPCYLQVYNVVDIGAYEYPTEPVCIADWDGNGVVEPSDIFAYLSDFFAGNQCADLDLLIGLDPSDIFAFLAHWFAGCA